MNFLCKAAVILVVVTLLIAQLTFIFLQASNQVIDASKRELAGIAGVRELTVVLGDAQELRRTFFRAGGRQTPVFAEQLGRVEEKLASLDAVHGTTPQVRDAFKFARDAAASLKAPAEGAQEAFTRADEFVQQLLRLIATLSDTSSLSQDPDPDSYQLMLASTQETLLTVRMMSRMRDLGEEAIAAGRLEPFMRRVLEGDSYVMYGHLELLFARYERVVKANPGLAAALAFEEAFKPVNGFMRAVRKGPLVEGAPVGDAAAYAAAGLSAINSVNALSSRSHASLTRLVEARIAHKRQARNLQLGLALAGLLVAGYFFFCFYLVTRDGMRELTRHVDAMARGDLTTTPRLHGRDEAAKLMGSVGLMQQALRHLIGQVHECTDAIVITSSEVSAGAADLSERTDKAAGSLQQTAAAMHEIAATVKRTAARTGESATMGQENARGATQGADVIGRVVATMKDIQVSSDRIGEITGVIDAIAFQSNILALNAAVEAARAGEQGRGFAVVASEVRALAKRSAEAAREINQLIAASAAQTRGGTQVVGVAGDIMGKLVSNAKFMSDLLENVSTAASEQTRGLDQVNAAVVQLEQDTQRNAALVEQTTAAALSMQRKAGELAATAARFTR